MRVDIIKATQFGSGHRPVWIWVDKIVAISLDSDGDTVVHLVGGTSFTLHDKVEEVWKTLGNLAGGIVGDIK